MLLQVVEEAAHFGGLHPALVVVEDDVVRLVGHLEALDVALAQVEVRPQGRQERLEVVVAPRVDPHLICKRGRARHLRAEVGRHLARLLPVACGDPDQARLERVVVVLLAPVAQVVDQRAHLGRRELLMRDAADGRQLLGANRGAAPRHHHLLVPAEERQRLAQIADLGEALAELVEAGLAHDRGAYISAQLSGGPGEGSEDDPSPGFTGSLTTTADGVCIRRLPGTVPPAVQYGRALTALLEHLQARQH